MTPSSRATSRALVAPCTTTIRNLASEVLLEPGVDPVPLRSAVNLDAIESVSIAILVERLGRLAEARMRDFCAALAVAVDCSGGATSRRRCRISHQGTEKGRARCSLLRTIEDGLRPGHDQAAGAQQDPVLEPRTPRDDLPRLAKGQRGHPLRIRLTSLYVDDQRAALKFYTEVLGFIKHHEIPLGDDLWLTVVSPDTPDGPELMLEPSRHPAVKPYRDALVEDGIPLAQFAVDDVESEHSRLTEAGVSFTQPPSDIGTAVVAVFDDTCGNLIQLIAEKATD